MILSDWISDHYIEIFGAVTGILYVFLEIRQTILLWPVGIITSAVYIWVFFRGKLYADMSLQIYYLIISILGWYWWVRGTGERAQSAEPGAHGEGQKEDGDEGKEKLAVTRIDRRITIMLTVIFAGLYFIIWFILSRLTDSPVPQWDSFITSLSIVATWMLARKIYEHWFLWIVVNSAAAILFLTRGLYPTVVLYIVYGIMSFAGLRAWRKSMVKPHPPAPSYQDVTPHPPAPSPGGEGE